MGGEIILYEMAAEGGEQKASSVVTNKTQSDVLGQSPVVDDATRSHLPTSGVTSSLERRACRICQSESGEMVRPCGCAGTMGDIHETCLSKWVATAPNRNKCEICNEEYAKSGWHFKKLSQWSKPTLDTTDVLSYLCMAGLMYSLYYLIELCIEREFYTRFVEYKMAVRTDDFARFSEFDPPNSI